MYEQYWQLSEKPFDGASCARFYYPGQSHQAALLKLRYAVENHRGGALLSGPAGSGKTLAARMLRSVLDEGFSPWVHLVFPQMTTSELLAYLADELCGTVAEDGHDCDGPERSVRRMERFLAENCRRGQHAVVIIDEAHLIHSPHTLEAIRLLLNFEFEGRPAMTLLLCAQPAILPILQRTPQLEERLAVKCLLRAFSQQETAEYIEHRLRAAGAKRMLFEPEAVNTIHALANGIARRINRLCDLALLIGFAEQQQTISAELVEAVHQELVSVVPE
jgi:general secretion pathway protein A